MKRSRKPKYPVGKEHRLPVGSAYPDTPTRRLEYRTQLRDGYSSDAYKTYYVSENPNVVVSELENGKHAPAIDIDLPCRLIPSKSPGHYHLYIDVQIEWEKYVKLLDVMVECGIVEKEYRDISVKEGKTVLRLPPEQEAFDSIRQDIINGSDPLVADL